MRRVGRAHTKGIVLNCVYTTPWVWVKSNEPGFQSLNRRSRCSTRPSPFEVIASSLKTRFGAPEPLVIWAQLRTRRAQIWPYACMPNPGCSEPSREGRASVRNWAIECRFRARYAGWRFWLWGVQNRDFSKWRHRTAPKPVILVNSPPRFTLRRRA